MALITPLVQRATGLDAIECLLDEMYDDGILKVDVHWLMTQMTRFA